jgi:two-component system response regulator FlrC
VADILVVDDEEGIRIYLGDLLEDEGHQVTLAADGREALATLARKSFHLLLSDLRMPGMNGIELLERARAEQPEMQAVILTSEGTIETAVEAMKLGAFDYLQKPISVDKLRLLVTRALEHRRLKNLEERCAVDQAGDEDPLTHGDPAMAPVVDALKKVARTASTVLLVGASGTGKELAARAVHRWSERARGPFMAVNCAAISDNLLESELFGHEKGAFTGATAQRRGRIELAEGGTFFLDEVGELRLELQAKLLRVIQERSYERVGGRRTLTADVRWIAATNRDLVAEMAAGRFREDLYHRLAVFPVRLPLLCERKQDLLPLTERLLLRIGRQINRPGLSLTSAAQQMLLEHDWPGNVRELVNCLERAAIIADGLQIDGQHLSLLAPAPAPLQTPSPAVPAATTPADGAAEVPAQRRPTDSYRAPEDVDEDELIEALRAHHFRLAAAAKALNLSRTSLYALVERSSRIRKATDLSEKEITEALRLEDSKPARAAARLEVSAHALKLRMRSLGMG